MQIFLAVLSAEEFRQGSYDMGVSIQGFSNVGNGRFFWSSGNFLHKGTVSLLNSHFSWIYFTFYPIYFEFPAQLTLFVIQAVPIALAAIPLEALTTQISGSPRKGLLAASIYVVWAPMYAGMPNSFHLEGFLPVLFFSLFLVWYRKQYALGLVLAAFTGFTLDIAPIFEALIAVIFLTYPLEVALRARRERPGHGPDTPGTGQLSRALPWARRQWHGAVNVVRSRDVQACLGLILVAVTVFFGMRYLEAHFTQWIGISGNSLDLLRNPGISFSHVTVRLSEKIWFWVAMLATVGFLPLLYPRVVILLIPWMGYTFLESPLAWFSFTSHYVAIGAVPLFIGLAFGIAALPLSKWRSSAVSEPTEHSRSPWEEGPAVGAELPAQDSPWRFGWPLWTRWMDRSGTENHMSTRSTADSASARIPSRVAARWRGVPRSRRVYLGSVALVVGMLVGNVLINPADFATNGLIASTRNPTITGPGGGAYSLTILPDSEYNAVVELTREIPSDAPLLFQGQFYPVVGADPNAYTYVPAPLSLGGVQRSPFNNTSLPEYVLSTRAGLNPFNCLFNDQRCPGYNGSKTNNYTFSNEVWNQSIYGVVGWVQTTRFGSLYLFERGYTGRPTNFGPVTYSPLEFVYGTGLKPSHSGRAKHNQTVNQVANLTVISSANNRNGTMWVITNVHHSLAEGVYNLVIEIRTNGNKSNCASVPSSTPLLEVTGYSPQTSPVLDGFITHQQALCGQWVFVTLPFELKYPLGTIDFAGIRPPIPVPLSLNVLSVELVPVGPLST
ncbi:MAG: DUF2079 domain-containing protein [Thermoplasmata archaeon]